MAVGALATGIEATFIPYRPVDIVLNYRDQFTFRRPGKGKHRKKSQLLVCQALPSLLPSIKYSEDILPGS